MSTRFSAGAAAFEPFGYTRRVNHVLVLNCEINVIKKFAEIIGMGRKGFEPSIPAMSRRCLNQAGPPARSLWKLQNRP